MSYSVLEIGKTGPEGRIGSGTGYHIDSKYNRNLGFGDIVSRFDTKAAAYAKDGRKIVFSNPGVAGLVYDPSASTEDKINLLKRANDAHSHSVHNDFFSFDYYAPIGDDRYHKSAEGAPIYIVGAEGMKAGGDTGGGYGNFAYVDGSDGSTITKVGHGDDSLPVFAGGTFGSLAGGELPTGDKPDPAPPNQIEAMDRAKAYSDMSKAEMDAAYDKIRSDPSAAAEGMKMHKAFFGKR